MPERMYRFYGRREYMLRELSGVAPQVFGRHDFILSGICLFAGANTCTIIPEPMALELHHYNWDCSEKGE